MKKFKVVVPTKSWDTYIVEAKSRKDAIHKVDNREVEAEEIGEYPEDFPVEDWDVEEISQKQKRRLP